MFSTFPCYFFDLCATCKYFFNFQIFGGLTKNIFFVNGSWLDADPGLRDPCVVAAMDKFTRTTEILWRKRDGMAAL